jgi:hypothetical protein
MILRYQWRAVSYALFMRNEYPPFDFAMDADRVTADPAVLTVVEPAEMSRGLIFVKWLLLIPHYIAILVLAIVTYVVVIVAFFAVLFTGKWPKGMRDFVVGVVRWEFRVTAYLYFMTDDYPPFSLE